MLSNRCCYNGTITGAPISTDPTANDTNYPIGFIGWTPDNKAFLHVGSGTWIDITAKAPDPGNASVEPYYKKVKNVAK